LHCKENVNEIEILFERVSAVAVLKTDGKHRRLPGLMKTRRYLFVTLVKKTFEKMKKIY